MPRAVFGEQQSNEAAAGSYFENNLTAKIEASDHMLDRGVAVMIVKHGKVPGRKIPDRGRLGNPLFPARRPGAQ
jgi:hypothetical protein